MLNKKITQLHSGNAHYENRKQYNATSTEDFDELIRASERQGFSYIPEVYNEQMYWLRSRYYKATGGSGKVIVFRIFDQEDIQTTEQEVHATLQNKYGNQLHPVLQERAIYLLQTTIGQKYDPSSTQPFVVQDYSFFRNTYKPPTLTPTAEVLERPYVWQQYLDRIMPPENLCTLDNGTDIKEQDYFEAWLAQRIQTPTEPNTVIMVLRGEHGTGKGFIGDMLMKQMLGKSNYQACSLDQLTGKYVEGLYSKTLIQIEEAILSNRNKITQQLKALATQEEQWAEAKYRNATKKRKYFGIYLTSNEEYPVRIENNDRRFFVPCFSQHLNTPVESHEFYKDTFLAWLKEQDGYQIMVNYFHSLDIKGFNFLRPPMTASKEALMETDDNASQLTHRVSLMLQNDYKDYAFKLEAVVKKWKLSNYHAAKALTGAGFKSKLSRHFNTEGENGKRLWVHHSFGFDNPYENLKLFNPDKELDSTILVHSKRSPYPSFNTKPV
jgi:hypothetical protein